MLLKSKLIFLTTVVVTVLLVYNSVNGSGRAVAQPEIKALPEFTYADQAQWINSKPLKVADLRGQVVLLDFWTFECWNCYRSFPWLVDLEKQYQDKGLTVIGIHTPEIEREKVRDSIVAKTKEFNLHHPVMIDNDFLYWRALGNRYWPAFYLVDKKGYVRGYYVGETHKGDKQAVAIAEQIEVLLAE